MYVKDLQQFLSKFTEADNSGRQGNAITHAKLYVERDGFLEEIRRMEVHEHTIIGHPGLRLVLKTKKEHKLILPNGLSDDKLA